LKEKSENQGVIIINVDEGEYAQSGYEIEPDQNTFSIETQWLSYLSLLLKLPSLLPFKVD